MPRSRPSVASTFAFVLALVFSLLAAAPAAQASNTRTVYFGSAPCPSGSATCPSSTGWPYPYPYGTGGGYTGSGQPIAGQNSFSPVTTGGSTATDIVISNASPSTLTQIQLNGGTAAPPTINTTSVPFMPSPPTPADPAFFDANGNAILKSLPTGLYYQPVVYVVSNPSAIPVNCSFTASSSAGNDGLHCSIGNLAAQQSLTLRIIVTDVSAGQGTTEPWFELGLKEGASGTGSNSDTFFTYSELTVAPATCAVQSTFALDNAKVDLGNEGLGCLGTAQGGQTTHITTPVGFGNGTIAQVGNSDQPTLCNGTGFTCFGQASYASVDGGANITGGLQWTIEWAAAVVPSGGPKGAIHFLQTGGYEYVYFKPKYLCDTTITKLCYVSLTKDSFGNYIAVLKSPQNYYIKGF